MNPAPSASIIIPVYNDEAGLTACLQALQRQRHPHHCMDVIVVDNGSRPPVAIDSGRYSFPIRVLACHTPGAYAARNAGAAAARHALLAFTDADCIPHPDWLSRGCRALLSGTGQQVVGGDVVVTAPAKRSAVALYQYETGFQQQDNIRDKGFAVTANLFCTATQFRQIGPFDERLLSGGDREWSWRAARAGMRLYFAADAIVFTAPRTTLAGAIRQARRTAAGRIMLRRLRLDHLGPQALARHRSAWSSMRWILTHPGLSRSERLRVAAVASLIRAAALVERLRLALAFTPERR